VLGTHKATGIRPRFSKRAEEYGFQVPVDLFRTD